jgi:ribosomal protein S13
MLEVCVYGLGYGLHGNQPLPLLSGEGAEEGAEEDQESFGVFSEAVPNETLKFNSTQVFGETGAEYEIPLARRITRDLIENNLLPARDGVISTEELRTSAPHDETSKKLILYLQQLRQELPSAENIPRKIMLLKFRNKCASRRSAGIADNGAIRAPIGAPPTPSELEEAQHHEMTNRAHILCEKISANENTTEAQRRVVGMFSEEDALSNEEFLALEGIADSLKIKVGRFIAIADNFTGQRRLTNKNNNCSAEYSISLVLYNSFPCPPKTIGRPKKPKEGEPPIPPPIAPPPFAWFALESDGMRGEHTTLCYLRSEQNHATVPSALVEWISRLGMNVSIKPFKLISILQKAVLAREPEERNNVFDTRCLSIPPSLNTIDGKKFRLPYLAETTTYLNLGAKKSYQLDKDEMKSVQAHKGKENSIILSLQLATPLLPFICIIQTPFQKAQLEQFRPTCVHIDATHGLNHHKWPLTTLLFHNHRTDMGVPVGYMISSTATGREIAFFIETIARSITDYRPLLVMSDDDKATHLGVKLASAKLTPDGGNHISSVLCHFHLFQAIERQIKKRGPPPSTTAPAKVLWGAFQVEWFANIKEGFYRGCKNPIIGDSGECVITALDSIISSLGSDPRIAEATEQVALLTSHAIKSVEELKTHIENYYLSSDERIKLWATGHWRLPTLSKTNNFLEGFHSIIKNTVSGELTRRVDALINLLTETQQYIEHRYAEKLKLYHPEQHDIIKKHREHWVRRCKIYRGKRGNAVLDPLTPHIITVPTFKGYENKIVGSVKVNLTDITCSCVGEIDFRLCKHIMCCRLNCSREQAEFYRFATAESFIRRYPQFEAEARSVRGVGDIRAEEVVERVERVAGVRRVRDEELEELAQGEEEDDILVRDMVARITALQAKRFQGVDEERIRRFRLALSRALE